MGAARAAWWSVLPACVLVGLAPVVPVSPRARGLAAADALAPAVRMEVPARRITFAFGGDTLPHLPVIASAERWGNGTPDFAPMYARIEPIVSWADLAVCHLETPVAPAGVGWSTHPRYAVPGEIAVGIASAGYDRCSTASNHSYDQGDAGITATIAALEANALSQSGMARSPDEAVPVVLTVAGVRVAHLSYTWSFNGLRLPPDRPWLANLLDPDRVVADATAARAAGAELVVVSLHWGFEGSALVTPYQREVAEVVIGSGVVDLIVGHHAHVVQPIEQVAGRWVVYGMGNQLSNMPTGAVPMPASQDGILVTVVATEQAGGGFVVERPVAHPTWVDRDRGHVIRPVLGDLADADTPAPVRAQLAESLARTRRVVGDFLPSPA